jgi:protein TonB
MFEHSLIDLDAKKKSRRRWLALPVAIVLHLVALGSLTFAQYWHVGQVEEPPLNLVFVTGQELPPPARGSNQPHPAPTPRPAATPAPQPVTRDVQPTTVPDRLPPVTTPVIDNLFSGPGPIDGVDHGDPNSTVTLPNSHGDGPVTAPMPEAPRSDEPIHVGAGVTPPEIVTRIEPRYTDIARHAGTEGVVVLQAVIDEQGMVTNLSVIKGLPMGLEQAALDAVRQWRFKPALQQGRPVKVYYNLTVRFSIQR